MKWLQIGLLTLLSALLSTGRSAFADPIEYCTPDGSTVPNDGSVDAEALFTLGSGKITVTLTDLFENPKSAGQLVSGITFNVTGASGSGTLTSAVSGQLVTTISSGGPYTVGVTDPLTR